MGHSALCVDLQQISCSFFPAQRPYKGKTLCFGQTIFGLDPKADKYRPAWVRGAWLGKDSNDIDLIFDGQSVN